MLIASLYVFLLSHLVLCMFDIYSAAIEPCANVEIRCGRDLCRFYDWIEEKQE